MTDRVWARLDAAPTSSHPVATVIEVTQPLDPAVEPGVTVFVGMTFVDITAINGVVPGWTMTDGVSVGISLVVTSLTGILPGWTTTDGASFVPPVVPQAAPVTAAELLAAANTQQSDILAQVWTFNVGTVDIPINLTTMLGDKGLASMNTLTSWCLLNAGNSSATEPYSNVDNTPFTLTLAQVRSLVTQAGAVFSASIAVLNELSAGIKAAPPTITTLAQVTGAAWPTP